VAEKSFRCANCGKSFWAARAIGIVFGILSFFFLLVAITTVYGYMTDTVTNFLFGSFETTFVVSFMATIMLAVIRVVIRANMVMKHGSTPRSMVCPECKKKAADLAEYNAYNLQQASDVKAWEWAAKVESIERNDLWMGRLITSWRAANPGKVPSEVLVQDLTSARNMEKAGNYEASAIILERYHFWDEAGRVRRLDDEKIIKHITVDMNQLIDQVSTRGLAIPYKCHSCGASITIDGGSKKEGLKFCSYCGTTYNVEDMTKIIQVALS
jgi:DNA-directed RNA polymerase subunit RPC12/RpoP